MTTSAWTVSDVHRVCSWCSKVLHEGHPECRVTTHGICPDCESKVLEDEAWSCEICGDPVTNPSSRVCEDCENHWGPFPKEINDA